MNKVRTLYPVWTMKHKKYIRACRESLINVAEGAVRAGKTIDNVTAFAYELERSPDRIHLATGSTSANAKLNIGDANGYGLEYQFRGRCRWGKFKGNECLYVRTSKGLRVVIFAGGAKADSYKKIRGNSYGLWIATEINLHHDNTIREAFNRQLAARKRKIFWDLNPDNPGAPIYRNYLDRYQERAEQGELIGGYNYQHFTIFDNASLPESRRAEIISQYVPGSLWYMRDIEGKRCAAQGAVYPYFAEHKEEFYTDSPDFDFIQIGVDIGGTRSWFAFAASGIKEDYSRVTALSTRRHKAQGLTPEDFYQLFLAFEKHIARQYPGREIRAVYSDSAEQTLKNGLAVRTELPVRNSLKRPIMDRVRCENILMAQGRLFLTRDCASLEQALEAAVYDDRKLEDERLDDGTSDIDTLDAFEYSWERYLNRLVRASRRGEGGSSGV